MWTLGGDDLNDDDLELEDEDLLLENEEEKVDIQLPIATDDCGVSDKPSRKACKNCSCGRAEEENKGSNKPVPVVSACGSVSIRFVNNIHPQH